MEGSQFCLKNTEIYTEMVFNGYLPICFSPDKWDYSRSLFIYFVCIYSQLKKIFLNV